MNDETNGKNDSYRNSEMITDTYDIPSQNYPGLVKKIKRINKKAVKWGITPINLELVKTFTRKVRIDTGFERIEVLQSYHRVTITGETVKIDGWELIASIDHNRLESGGYSNIVNIVPDKKLPEKYRTSDPFCDHCNVNRYRKKTYVLKKGKVFKQIGSTCVKDYLGHDPEKMIRSAESFFNVTKGLGEESEFGPWSKSSDYGVDTVTYLAWVSRTIINYGWVSRGNAYESHDGVVATADLAIENMFSKKTEKVDIPVESDYKKAKNAVEWAKTIKPNDDYLHNIITISNLEFIEFKHTGYAASIIGAYDRAMERERRNKVNFSDSVYLGEPKSRITGNVTVLSVKSFPSDWGVSGLHNMISDSGSVIIWWASESAKWLEPGDKVNITATVKKHQDYNGVKQTVVTRLKVNENA